MKWIGADKVTGVKEYKELLKIEQDEYQSQFAAALETTTAQPTDIFGEEKHTWLSQ